MLVSFAKPSYIVADDGKDIEQELTNNVNDQLNKIDFSDLNNLLNGLSDQFNLFGGKSFKDKIQSIINGTYFNSYDSMFAAIIDLIFDGVKSFLPYFLIIIAISVLSSVVKNVKASNSSNGVNDLIHFVCYAVVIILLVTSFTQISKITLSTITSMQKQMNVIFPILLTMLTAVGGLTSVGIYKPIVAILSGGVSILFNNILFPIFIISFIFIVIGNLTKNIKLDRFIDFFSSSFKWICGFIFTIFSAFLTIQGISAGRYDGISIKATKFAVKSYVPIIGGFLSDGFDFIMLSSVLIKNAIGVGGLLLIFITILSPILHILIFKLGLQLVAAILQSIGDEQISNFTSKCAKILSYPIVLILGVAFMYLLTTGLIMCTANIM